MVDRHTINTWEKVFIRRSDRQRVVVNTANLTDETAVVVENFGLVKTIAKHFSWRCGTRGPNARQDRALESQDLIQAASLGLVMAARKYDPKDAKGATLGQYAKFYMRKEAGAAAYQGGVVCMTHKMWVRVYESRRRMDEGQEVDFSLTPGLKQAVLISRSLCVELGQAMRFVLEGHKTLVQDLLWVNPVTGEPTFGHAGLFVEPTIDTCDLCTLIQEIVAGANLTDKERLVIVKLFELDDEPQDGVWIAQQLGITKQRVGQIKVVALGKLKAAILASPFRDEILEYLSA